MDSTEHYLGLKNNLGKLVELIIFKKNINFDGKTMEVYTLPSKNKKNIDISDAKQFWKIKIEEGFSKVDPKLAIAFAAKINSKEISSKQTSQSYSTSIETLSPEEIKINLEKIKESKINRTTVETITEILFNQDCEYSFTSYSKNDENVIVRYLEYETDESKTEEYKREDARKLWTKLREENFQRVGGGAKIHSVILGSQCD